jgi:glycosyltransferase involved in cell wall biosynthesis
MRIAQVAPLAESVPPKLYGGTERVISWLTEELVAQGHDVTLFASGDSRTKANLIPGWPRAIRLSRPRPDPIAALAVLLDRVANYAKNFDLIHCHTDWLHMPLFGRLGVPFVTTPHGRLDMPGYSTAICQFPEAPLISISNNQRLALPGANWLGTVYHGLPTSLLRPSWVPGEYLAFLGRMSPEKGPETAIRIARATRMPLRMAAKVPRDYTRYFKQRIEPLIDGTQVRMIGEVNDDSKQSFLAGAAALLFPIDWPEPFGLVMIEAMACGTPVIAFRSGSVPEVIDDGLTGFVVDSEAEAVDAIRRLGEIDRRTVRAAFEQRFTSMRMAEDYLRYYEMLIEPRPHEVPAIEIQSGSALTAPTLNPTDADVPVQDISSRS